MIHYYKIIRDCDDKKKTTKLLLFFFSASRDYVTLLDFKNAPSIHIGSTAQSYLNEFGAKLPV